MRYRYRKLSGRVTPRAIEEAMRDQNVGSDAGALFVASVRASAVRDVSATEGELSFDELAGALQAGQLTPGDLVHCEGRWVTFEEAVPFHELCEPLVDRASRARKLMISVAAGSAILAAVLGIMAAMAGH